MIQDDGKTNAQEKAGIIRRKAEMELHQSPAQKISLDDLKIELGIAKEKE